VRGLSDCGRRALTSQVSDALGRYDQYGLTCVRDVPVDEVLRRLGVPAGTVPQMCTEAEAQVAFPAQPFLDAPPYVRVQAERIGVHGRWTFLIDVEPHGLLLEPELLTRLSVGTEAISAWYVMSSTVHVAYAVDGRMQATFNSWTFQPPSGDTPERLDQMLRTVGCFSEIQEEAIEEEEWTDSQMVLAALERGFGLELPAEMVSGSMLTVGLPRKGNPPQQ
jgi:hypothetical protein